MRKGSFVQRLDATSEVLWAGGVGRGPNLSGSLAEKEDCQPHLP